MLFLQEGQQHRGGDPFIGVVGGIVKDLGFALPNGNRPDGQSPRAAADGPGAEVGVAQQQAGEGELQHLRCKSDAGGDHGEVQRNGDGLPGAEIAGVQFGVGGRNGGDAGIVLLGKPPEGIPLPELHKPGADEPGHHGLPGGGIAAAGGGQALCLLELPQGVFSPPAKAAIDAAGLIARAG